jgi:hypothetical protein
VLTDDLISVDSDLFAVTDSSNKVIIDIYSTDISKAGSYNIII